MVLNPYRILAGSVKTDHASSTSNSFLHLDHSSRLNLLSSADSSCINDFSDTKSEFSASQSVFTNDQFHEAQAGISVILEKHYKFIVKYLPILTILCPCFILTILKIFQLKRYSAGQYHSLQKQQAVFHGEEQKTINYHTLVIDLVSVCIICWILKFLLDWPWDWYIQISEIKEKLNFVISGIDHDEKQEVNVKSAIYKNYRILSFQHWIASLFCLLSPFCCGWILFLARDYIVVLNDSDDGVFSDLNIGIFVSSGLIRLVIQMSSYIQKATALIELNTEKLLQELNHAELTQSQDNDINMSVDHAYDDSTIKNQTSLSSQALELDFKDKLMDLSNQVNQLSNKFELFYSKHKFIIDSSDQSFISSKHFKILEKEVNQINFKLSNKIIEFETNFREFQKIIDSSISQNHQYIGDQSAAVVPLPTPPELQTPISLHGIPLTSKSPTYILSNPVSSIFSTSRLQNQSANNTFGSQLSNITRFLPVIRYVYDGAEKNERSDDDDPFASSHQELTNLNSTNGAWDIGPRPIIGLIFNAPFAFNRTFWKIVSFIPLKVLKVIHLVLLIILDFLVESLYNRKTSVDV